MRSLKTVSILAAAAALSGILAWAAKDRLHDAYLALRHPVRTPGELGDGGPVRALSLRDPGGLAEDAKGRLYIVDRGRGPLQGGIVWRIDPGGIAHAIAGTGAMGDAEDGPDARAADLGRAEDLCLDGSGAIVFTDSRNHLVLRLEAGGGLARIAGTGRAGADGDGGPALAASLDRPYDIACGADGTLYVADAANHRIRKIAADGTITTVAGTGEPGGGGEGGPAVSARLHTPYGVLIDGLGRLLIADSENHVVRRVEADGVIATVAGTGARGYEGDGGPAREAAFDTPQALALGGDGRLYVGDEHNHAIRVIGRDGTVETVIGTGGPGVADPGAPASSAALNDPEDVLLRDDGTLVVLDSDNGRVLSVGGDGRVRVLAGGGAD